jgi:hypothetical protein
MTSRHNTEWCFGSRDPSSLGVYAAEFWAQAWNAVHVSSAIHRTQRSAPDGWLRFHDAVSKHWLEMLGEGLDLGERVGRRAAERRAVDVRGDRSRPGIRARGPLPGPRRADTWSVPRELPAGHGEDPRGETSGLAFHLRCPGPHVAVILQRVCCERLNFGLLTMKPPRHSGSL